VQQSLGFDVGSFISASEKISKTASQLNISGSVSINAFQLGGNPTELSKILSSSAAECDIRNLTACQDTAKKLIDYVSNVFPNQFQKDDHGIWTSPLVPLTELIMDYSVSDFGLKLSPTFVTQELTLGRKQIEDLFLRNSYYNKNLVNVIARYPVAMSSEVVQFSKNFQQNALILVEGVDLYNFPSKGVEKLKDILGRADAELESKYLTIHKSLENFVDYKFNLYGRMCLRDDWEWKFTVSFENIILPNGSASFAARHASSPMMNFQFVSAKGFGEYTYKMNDDNQMFWEMSVTANSAGDKYQGTLNCHNLSLGTSENYAVSGDVLSNKFIFPKYGN